MKVFYGTLVFLLLATAAHCQNLGVSSAYYLQTTGVPTQTCSVSSYNGVLAVSKALNVYQCSNNNIGGTYQWNLLTSSSGGAAVPSGMIAFIATGPCPSGWTENDAMTGYNVLVTSTANSDIGTHGPSTLTASAQTFTGTASQSTSAVSAGTPAGTNAMGGFAEGAISWPANPPTFSGTLGTTSAVSAGTPSGTNSSPSVTVTTAGYASSTTNYSFNKWNGTTLTSGTTSVTIPAETFTGVAMATHTHTLTPTGTIAYPANVPVIGAGTFTQPTFTGALMSTHSHTFTATGTNGSSTVSGTPAYFKVIACQKN